FGVDHRLARITGDLIVVLQHDRIDRAGFLAKAAENAADHVDLVAAGIAFARGVPLFVGIFRRFHEDGVGRAGGGAERTATATLEAVRMALQLETPTKALEHGPLDFRILERYWLLDPIFECGCQTLDHHINHGGKSPRVSTLPLSTR